MRTREHMIIGAVVGAAYGFATQMAPRSSHAVIRFDWSQVAVSSAVGTIAGLIPDLLEPATHPNHRKFFHSITAGLGVICLLCGKHTHTLPLELRHVLAATTAGYLSHLAADATTPRSTRIF